MDDRISRLHDVVLCHILSFLPTKTVVATSVLSKRWEPLWRSVPTLQFHYDHDNNHDIYQRFQTFSYFVQSVYACILLHDIDQPIKKFSLRCSCFDKYSIHVKAFVSAVVQRGVEHLHLSLDTSSPPLPSLVYSCKTLVVLKLAHLIVGIFSSLDLPALKLLHLDFVFFKKRLYFSQLLSATPNLEDFKALHVYFFPPGSKGNFKRLPKLVRLNTNNWYYIFANDSVEPHAPWEVFSNVEFLCIDWMDHKRIPEFHNLTHLEFIHEKSSCIDERRLVLLEVLKHIPKLQVLVVDLAFAELLFEETESTDGVDAVAIPHCISFHLKTCRFKSYEGSTSEFLLARYMMLNARFLQEMTIIVSENEDEGDNKPWKMLEMITNLSSCTRCSATCKLSFEYQSRGNSSFSSVL